jgi:hypothetical protein
MAIISNIIYFFVCRKNGHEIRKIHPKYPATNCYKCFKKIKQD